MSIRYSFMDNTAYGASDINYALSRLTTQGVSLFKYSDGDNPLLALNNATAAIADVGVDLYNVDACKVTYTNSCFSILPGTAFMADGAFITILDEAYDITSMVTEHMKNAQNKLTVCFYRSVANNDIEIKLITDDEEIDGDAVILAEIFLDNSILDKRTFAKSKIAPASGNIVQKFHCDAYSIMYIDDDYRNMKASYSGVFEGASYCFYGGKVFEIQRQANKEDLKLTRCETAGDDSRCYVAFNLLNGTLQLWVHSGANYISVKESDIYVF